MEFVKNHNLEVIKPDYLGNPMLKGRFLNYQKIIPPKLTDILRWRFTNNHDRSKKRQSPWAASLYNLTNVSNKSQDRIIWLGHASFLICFNGKNILIDPVFGNIPFVKRLVGMPCSITELIDIDYILLSHAHYDHIDKNSLRQVSLQNPKAIIYCGLNHRHLLNKFGITNLVIEAGWYQKYPLRSDGLEFYFLPALHWSNRTAFDRNTRLWGSFVIKSNLTSIYFMGDSGYSAHFKDIGSLFSSLDYCLMGIAAYTPRSLMQFSHTNPQEAIQGFHDLNGMTFIPMHYGTYDLTDEPLREPLELLNELVASNSVKGQVMIPIIGEPVLIKPE